MFYKKMIVLAAAMLCMEFAAFGMYVAPKLTVDTSKVAGSRKTPRMRKVTPPTAPAAPQVQAPAAQASPGFWQRLTGKTPTTTPVTPTPVVQAKTGFWQRFGASLPATESEKREARINQEFGAYAEQPYFRGKAVESILEEKKKQNWFGEFFSPITEAEVQERQIAIAKPSFEKLKAERIRGEEDAAVWAKRMQAQAAKNTIGRGIRAWLQPGVLTEKEAPDVINPANLELYPVRRAQSVPQAQPVSQRELEKISAVQELTGLTPEQQVEAAFWKEKKKLGFFNPAWVIPGQHARYDKELGERLKNLQERLNATPQKAAQQPVRRNYPPRSFTPMGGAGLR